MAESRDLPGWPKKKLVRDVRRHLASYGIQPTARFALTQRQWHLTWAWASNIAKSYVFPRWRSHARSRLNTFCCFSPK